MTKTRIFILVLFVLAFAAGATSALVVGPWLCAPPPPRERFSLARELNLTPAQQQEMRTIWSEIGWRDESERRRAMQKQRDEAIRRLVPEDQQARLDEVYENYGRQMAELSEQRRRAFQQAIEKTKVMLTEEQREKYERMLSRRLETRRAGPGRERSTPSGDHGESAAGEEERNHTEQSSGPR